MKNNLNKIILKYFLLFSILILGLLWLFQFLFFNSFYKTQKINDIKEVANKLKNYQKKEEFQEYMNNLALDKSVCIEIDNSSFDQLYTSTYFGKGCISNFQTTYQYKFDFVNNKKQTETYRIENERFKTETIIYAIKLNEKQYAFINASIEPVDGTVNLIRKELIVITILVLILSYVLASFISNILTKPIKEISKNAKKLAKGNFEVNFRENNNILEIEELAKTLNYAKKELNKIEELRRDLMANVSHDLKTPLTMIKANAEIAKDLHMNQKEKQLNDLNTIIQETDRLTILVNDILTISKMESIKEELEITKFDLVELIDTILSRYQILQETEKYTFHFQHKEKNCIIEADKKRLEQVIYNLINNAINYTGEDNTITIRIEQKESIKVEVKDTGKGMKEEEIPYIWDKYYKNEKKHKRNLIGTGLGLSIVKKILEQHHYNYGVISKINKGTTFYFYIPKIKE